MTKDEIEIRTSQLRRSAADPWPATPPSDWAAISRMSKQALWELGLRPWNDPDEEGMVLMLFPGLWYDAIPSGLEIVDINGERERFVRGVTDNDIRFGCLAYGILVSVGP